MRRTASILGLLAFGTQGCALDFDKFLDGDYAPIDAAVYDSNVTDGSVVQGCPLPWLVVAIAHPSATGTYDGTLARFALYGNSTHGRCRDITGNVPSRIRGLVALSPTRFGIASPDDTFVLDTTTTNPPLPINNFAGEDSVDVFALDDGGPVLGVTYHSTSGSPGTVQTVRFFDALHGSPHGIGTWTLGDGTVHFPTGATPSAVSSHPGSYAVSSMKMLVVFSQPDQPVYEAEPLRSHNSGPFWGSYSGVAMQTVRSVPNLGAAMVGTNGSTTAVYLTNNANNVSMAPDGPYTCDEWCDSYRYATRDPTNQNLVIAICERSNDVHVVRWDVRGSSCSDLLDTNVAASDPIAGITIAQ